ncbi:MAG: threonine--tRNA ligase [Aquificaceae bacterium]|nr:threonine--tRNA ligase [Aquificaceae bacterium]MDW8236849.1 threonine--tRNA ligase [Aquificaceae bacterium]
MVSLCFEGQWKEFEEGTKVGEILQAFGIEDALGVEIDNELLDLQTGVFKSGEIKPIKRGSQGALEIMRHSLSHILAQALKELYGNVKLGIGPTTEDGFYYDVEIENKQLSVDDLRVIEEKMKQIVQKDYKIERSELDKDSAIKLFQELGESYKVELIERLGENIVSVYKQDGFIDLCKGPHLPSTGFAGAFKLTHLAGAYWLGDSKRPMLQRIYGIAFWSEEDLKSRLDFYEEVKRRDHRTIGKDMELFLIDEDVGAGLVIWLPRGAILRGIIEDFWKKEHRARNYQLVYTPHVGNSRLWQISGHIEHYSQSMFASMQIESEEYYVKPMNCPFHVAIYKSKVRSYKELPLKLAELGTVYRYEMSGTLHGLFRVRGFTQDDAHIICTPEQANDVIKETLSFTIEMLNVFGFKDIELFLSTRPEDSIGSDEHWEVAQNALKGALESLGLDYKIDEGGGAFYGPKIDLKIKDAIGRLWQCSTIQFDFNLPERFDMEYISHENVRKRPLMIHRAIFGSIERFTGILLEHYAGALPLWLSPIQARVLPVINKRDLDYAKYIQEILSKEGFRVDIDERPERLPAKVRQAQIEKIPYMIIVGEKEAQSNKVSLRSRSEGEIGIISIEELREIFNRQIPK